MNIGKLRKKITIQSSSESPNTYGERVRTWADFAANRWAEVNPKTGRELFLQQQTVDEERIIFAIRWVKSITPKMKVVYDGLDYDIRSVVNVNNRNRELQLECIRSST